jgi:hypothetical protein
LPGVPPSCFQAEHAGINQPSVWENPHQKGVFYGNLDELFEQLHGKEISYNNLLDIDAAVSLIAEFAEPTSPSLSTTMPAVWHRGHRYYSMG